MEDHSDLVTNGSASFTVRSPAPAAGTYRLIRDSAADGPLVGVFRVLPVLLNSGPTRNGSPVITPPAPPLIG